MTSPPVLELRRITKEYFGTTVLEGVDLELREGEIHALLGENGAGKSTLMNVLFGMPVIRDTGGFTGDIRVGGERVEISAPAMAMRFGIGMVHQEFMLIPGFTIYENVKLNRERVRRHALSRVLGPSFDLLDVRAMREDTRAALARVRLEIPETTTVGELPVGQRQFVEIAREVDKGNIRAIVFDEPTAVLAESEADQLLLVMRDLRDRGAAILFITHRLDEVMRIADTVTILRDGQRVALMPTSETSIEEIARLMVGRELEAARTASSSDAARERDDIVLSIRDLSVRMPGEEVRELDLDVRRGEILGIAGLGGQGKIGIANGLMGIRPASGTVLLDGEPLSLNDAKGALRAGLAFVSEDRRGVGLLLGESIEMNIAVPAVQVSRRFLTARALGPLALLDRRAIREQALRSIAELDIRATGPAQIVRRLSGGNQQKVCLARALVLDPRILFVSEPTRGIDVGAKELILSRLERLNQEEGLTIVMTSSELGELRSLCHRVVLVTGGRVAGILPPDAPDERFGLLMSGQVA